MSYRVKTDVFEGPFDLLVYLIEHAEMSIYDIRISEITDQYIAYVGDMKKADVNVASEFMALAALLLEIKSKMLLPRAPKDADGESTVEDPRSELVAKLIEYKKYKSVTEILLKRSEEAAMTLFREPDMIIPELMKKDELPVDECLRGLTMEDLYKAFRDVMIRREKKIDRVRSGFRSVRHDNFTVDEKIISLRSVLKVSPRVKFYEMFSRDTTREEMDYTFKVLKDTVEKLRSISPLFDSDKGTGSYV